MNLKKISVSLILINSVFGKMMENLRKHRDIKLVTADEETSKLVSEPNYHTTKQFSENLLAIETKKQKVKMNKAVYLGMSILDISKRLMIMLNQSMRIEQNYVIQVLIALLFIL